MFVVEIENEKGNSIGALRIFKTPEDNLDVECKGLSLADMEFDDIFGTNDEKVRVMLNESPTFQSNNYINVGGVKDDCRNLVLELSAYDALLRHYHDRQLYDCHVLIENYFGHIDYGVEFGYWKSHDEICLILYQNLLASFDVNCDGNNPFTDFVNRMRNKILMALKQRNYEGEY